MKISPSFRILFLLCIAALCCCAAPPVALMANNTAVADDVVFRLDAAPSEAEDEVIVSVFVQHAPDVYAYEVRLEYEPQNLKLIDAHSDLPGLSTEPVTSGQQIRFAHTQLGRIPGQSGDLQLATFVFKLLHDGDSTIRLHYVSLIASDLSKTAYEPDNDVHVKDAFEPVQLTDISGHWAAQAIVQAVNLGLVEGYPDGTFRPQREVSRGEFVTLLGRALHLEKPGNIGQPLADDSLLPEWAQPYIYAAIAKGWIVGYEDDTFRADRSITRMEMTAIIARTVGVKAATGELAYVDADQIPAWGYDAAATATSAGLVQGRDDHTFAPNDNSTRAEAVVLMLNLLKAIDEGHLDIHPK